MQGFQSSIAFSSIAESLAAPPRRWPFTVSSAWFLQLAIDEKSARYAMITGKVSCANITAMLILVVDDEIAIVNCLERMLLEAGHEVWARILDSHDSAEEIVSLAALGQFDVATIGLLMPAVSGDELAPRLRAVAPDMRIVMISCCAEGAMLRDQGIVDAYLSKPFEREQLLEIVACENSDFPF